MKRICLIPLLFLSACASAPKLALRPLPQPASSEAKSVRYPEVVRAYHIGRYADPNDGWVMHEQHVVYRVEESSRWDFHPGDACAVNSSPSAIPHDAAFAPPLVNDAIVAEVNSQRLASARIMSLSRVLSGALQQLERTLQTVKTNEQVAAGLRMAMDDVKKRLDALESAQKAMPAPNATATNIPPAELTP